LIASVSLGFIISYVLCRIYCVHFTGWGRVFRPAIKLITLSA
jgi:hypothetical protein